MNKHIATALAALTAASASLSSCSVDEELAAGGEGRVAIRTALSGDFNAPASRAVASEEALRNSLIVWISNSKGVVRHYENGNVPAEITLLADSYVAEAWAGDSVPASWDERWFKGSAPFTVTRDATASVEVIASVANVAARVEWSPTVAGSLTDYKMTIGHTGGSLEYGPSETRRGYFMLPDLDENNRNLTWSLTGTLTSGEAFSRSGVIAKAKAATEYVLKVTLDDDSEVTLGGGEFSIIVDENPLVEENTEILIKTAPIIKGVGFSFDGPISDLTEKIVNISSHGRLSDVTVSCDRFMELGFGANEFHLLSDAFKSYMQTEVEGLGLRYKELYDPSVDASGMKLVFETKLLDKMDDGLYTITITATDDSGDAAQGIPGRSTTVSMGITVGVFPVVTTPIDLSDPSIWAWKATVHGTVAEGMTPSTVGFNYRKAGETAWTYVEASRTGDSFSATLTALAPNTTYEYQAVGDGLPAFRTYSFVTEPDTQLPNCSFEEWVQDGKPWIPAATSAGRYWDSGNHGSTTLSASGNITTPYTDLVKSGTYSARLESKSIVGVLAAGNIFTGQYLGTNGTNGIVGFGRPFTSRPSAVRAWVKYTPSTMNKTDSSIGVTKGEPDQGSVIVALFTDEVESYTVSGKVYTSPAVVYTGDKHFFDPESPNVNNVIGYSKLFLTEATAGDGLVQITLPITYVREDVKAGNISVSFAASRYGDYFVGGFGSVMIVDDVELVY